jgi:hypothetical protein
VSQVDPAIETLKRFADIRSNNSDFYYTATHPHEEAEVEAQIEQSARKVLPANAVVKCSFWRITSRTAIRALIQVSCLSIRSASTDAIAQGRNDTARLEGLLTSDEPFYVNLGKLARAEAEHCKPYISIFSPKAVVPRPRRRRRAKTPAFSDDEPLVEGERGGKGHGKRRRELDTESDDSRLLIRKRKPKKVTATPVDTEQGQ